MLNMWKIVLRLNKGCQSARELICKDERCFSSLTIPYKTQHANIVKKYCANNCHTLAKENDPDVFGTLKGHKIAQLELDDDELKEQKFYKTRPPKMPKTIAIHRCIQKVGEEVKSNNLTKAIATLHHYGIQTNTYVYNIVLRELSRRGEMEECFKLFKRLKDIGLTPSKATFTTLINACAESKSPKAIERLDALRQMLHEKQIVLNDTHYNAMIKAYGRHGKTREAFKLVDEMCDNHLAVGDYTYSALLQAAISNKESGLRLALSTWHLMRYSRINPKKHHYDLLLMAMKHTKLGKLKADDSFLEEKDCAKLEYSETKEPNLLSSPPVMSGLLLPLVKGPGKGAEGIHTEIEKVNAEVSQGMTHLYQNVDSILKVNNLILFGGFEGILDSMQRDNVTPDVTTVTIILDMLPHSTQAEQYLLNYIENHNITVDTCFYNMLMRRRIARKKFQEGRDVLDLMQRAKITPDLLTYQIMALSCYRTRDALEFLNSISSLGYAPNKSIIAVLFKNACYNVDFKYVTFLLNYMKEYSLFPNEKIILTLKSFVKLLAEAKENRYNRIGDRKIKREKIPWMTETINEFLIKMIKKQNSSEKREKS